LITVGDAQFTVGVCDGRLPSNSVVCLSRLPHTNALHRFSRIVNESLMGFT